jgi:preprotein translocase subunit SecG
MHFVCSAHGQLLTNRVFWFCFIFDVLQIEDFSDNNNNQEGGNNNGDGSGGEMEQYEVERIATILAVTCMFLSALYIIFAVLLFLYFGNGGDEEATLNDEENDAPSSSKRCCWDCWRWSRLGGRWQ